MFLLDMASKVGGGPRSEATLLTQVSLAEVERPVSIKLPGVGETLVADITSEILLVPVTHHVKLKILPLHESLITRLAIPGLHLVNLLHVLHEISSCVVDL